MSNAKKPELIMIAGPNGSGKTSVTQKFLHHEWGEGVVYINPDEVAKDRFGDWNSDSSVLKAANYCEEWRERCLREKTGFVFETVFSSQNKIEFLLRAKQAGFFIRVFFIATNHPSINASRIAMRKGEVKHIFFVAETKGSLQSMQLNAIENAKIDCCSRLFSEMSTENVRYHKATCYQDLLDAMSAIK